MSFELSWAQITFGRDGCQGLCNGREGSDIRPSPAQVPGDSPLGARVFRNLFSLAAGIRVRFILDIAVDIQVYVLMTSYEFGKPGLVF